MHGVQTCHSNSQWCHCSGAQEILLSDINHGSYLQLWHTGHFLSFFHLDSYSPDLADILYAKYKNKYQELANNAASLLFLKLLLSLIQIFQQAKIIFHWVPSTPHSKVGE